MKSKNSSQSPHVSVANSPSLRLSGFSAVTAVKRKGMRDALVPVTGREISRAKI